MVRANMCDCCTEIYNEDNLKPILVGKYTLKMCPDCYNIFFKNYTAILADGKRNKKPK